MRWPGIHPLSALPHTCQWLRISMPRMAFVRMKQNTRPCLASSRSISGRRDWGSPGPVDQAIPGTENRGKVRPEQNCRLNTRRSREAKTPKISHLPHNIMGPTNHQVHHWPPSLIIGDWAETGEPTPRATTTYHWADAWLATTANE